jgi:hypothetical protein
LYGQSHRNHVEKDDQDNYSGPGLWPGENQFKQYCQLLATPGQDRLILCVTSWPGHQVLSFD